MGGVKRKEKKLQFDRHLMQLVVDWGLSEKFGDQSYNSNIRFQLETPCICLE